MKEGKAVVASLGKRIREMREAAGLSRISLARRAGVSEAAIWSWECGGRKPRSETLGKVARALGHTESDFGAGATEPTPPVVSTCSQQAGTPSIASILEEAKVKISEAAGVPAENVWLTIKIETNGVLPGRRPGQTDVNAGPSTQAQSTR